jgi:hypothetical protein
MRRPATTKRYPKVITLTVHKNVELMLSPQRPARLVDTIDPTLHKGSVIPSRLTGDYGH